MELNREHIIKALECCQTQYGRNCNECPYERHKTRSISVISCESTLRKDLLSLIKELTEDLHATRTELERVQEENERLRAQVQMWTDTAYCEKDRVNSIKADTIEEYRQKVNTKMGKHTHLLGKEYVQRILREVQKEMKGE